MASMNNAILSMVADEGLRKSVYDATAAEMSENGRATLRSIIDRVEEERGELRPVQFRVATIFIRQWFVAHGNVGEEEGVEEPQLLPEVGQEGCCGKHRYYLNAQLAVLLGGNCLEHSVILSRLRSLIRNRGLVDQNDHLYANLDSELSGLLKVKRVNLYHLNPHLEKLLVPREDCGCCQNQQED